MIFRNPPVNSYEVLIKNPTFLVQLNVWKNIPKNFDLIRKSPKYFMNRRDLIL